MNIPLRIFALAVLSLLFFGCTTIQTMDLAYSPEKATITTDKPVKIAVIPFEDTTLNSQENPYWIGWAPFYGKKLMSPKTISYLVTRDVKKEMAAFGFQLSTDEIYSIQTNQNDIKTLLKKIPYIQVDYLVGGKISHFFVQQMGSFIAEVEIEAFLVRPPQGNIIWSKKIGYREVRIPYTPDDFPTQSQEILNNMLQKTIRDLFRTSDFRLYAVGEKN
jgi:hypothetical protein